MRTLVLCDLHIGDPRYDNDYIEKLLLSEIYDQLIINGDFVDLWVSTAEDILKRSLFKFIENISKIKPVIWIKGNHDCDVEDDPDFFGIFGQIKVVELMELKENNRQILILHGHQTHVQKNQGMISKIASKLNCFVYKWLKIDIQTWFNSSSLYGWWVKKNRRDILKKYYSCADSIIIGHTHRVGYSKIGDVELFDIGSPLLTRSYGIIENGTIRLEIKQ